jgi:HK97 family phage prohead protease
MDNKIYNSKLSGVSEGPNGEKVYKFIATTSNVNRNGWVANSEGWELDNFLSNPIIGYQHNVWGNLCGGDDPDDVIGKATSVYVEGANLMIELIFDQENEKAMKIASKLDRGYLTSGSIGIGVIASHYGNEEIEEDPDVEYIDKQELVEFSIVNIPADVGARKQALRANTYDAIKYIYNAFEGKSSFTEIEDMKVGDVLAMLNKSTSNVNKEISQKDEISEIKEEIYKSEEANSEEQTDGNPIEQVQDEVDSNDLIKIEREREQETLTLTELG